MLRTFRRWFAVSVVTLVLAALAGMFMTSVVYISDRTDSYSQTLSHIARSIDLQLAQIYRMTHEVTLDQEIAEVLNASRFDRYRGTIVARGLAEYSAGVNLVSSVFVYNKRLNYFVGNEFVYPVADYFPDTGWLEQVNLDIDTTYSFARTVIDSRIRTPQADRIGPDVVTIALPLYVESSEVWLIVNLDAVRLTRVMRDQFGDRVGVLAIHDIDETLVSTRSGALEARDTRITSGNADRLRAVSRVLPWEYRVHLTTGQYLRLAVSAIAGPLLVSSAVLLLGILALLVLGRVQSKPARVLLADVGGRSDVDVLSQAHDYIVALEDARAELSRLRETYGETMFASDLRKLVRTGVESAELEKQLFGEGRGVAIGLVWLPQIELAQELSARLTQVSARQQWYAGSFVDGSAVVVVVHTGETDHDLERFFTTHVLNRHEIDPMHFVVVGGIAESGNDLHRIYLSLTAAVAERYYQPYGIMHQDDRDQIPVSVDHHVALAAATHAVGRSRDTDPVSAIEEYRNSAIVNKIGRGQIIIEVTMLLQVASRDASRVDDDGEVRRSLARALERMIRAESVWDTVGVLIEQLSVDGSGADGAIDQLTQRVRRYVTEHLHEPINIDSVADALGYSPTYMSRRYKAVAGHGVGDYLNTVRVRQAKEMMVDLALSLAQICEAVGYTSYQTFNRAFKRVVGESPASYRRRAIRG